MIKLVAFDLDFTLFDEKKTCLYEGVADGLVSLKKHFDLAIITNGSEKNQSEKIEQIKQHFKFIYYMGFSTRHKPDPWAFEKMLDDSGLSIDELIYVGNNPFTDFIPCKLLGIRSIRVCTDEYGHREVHNFLDADLRLETPTLVFEYLESLAHSGKT